ncbi:PAS domain S-box protein [Chryseolinea lacunae]|uniref:histidine kinase n=1 Tax=Chryseolinea lacunae TaxID=2801331 RepID=A0ABS1L2U5_9BACT|nr:PAS domain S-box protein [Chryseolinea lacunae]MBL0745832.1 PAS domain S-box protein [Chryseolinea lacunae]
MEILASKNVFPESEFALLAEVEDYAIFLLDKNGNIRSWNKGAEKIKGYTAADVLGEHYRMFYMADDQISKLPESLLDEARRQGRVINEGWRVGKNMKTLWASDVITALHDNAGTVVGFVKISREQTEGERAVESAPNAMLSMNREGMITLVNGQAEKLFGYARHELINQPVEMLIPDRFKGKHPHNRAHFFSAPKERAMGAGRELFARRKNGTEFPVEIGLNPTETPEGMMVLATIVDITERKKAEARFRLVVESAPNAIVLINNEGNISLVNSETEKLFGYSREELLGKEVESLIPSRFRSMHPHYRTAFFNKPQARPMGGGRDLFALRKDGSEFPVEIGLNPIESPEGNMVLASIIDISERKLLEANKLKSEFLANMSHELRTPLNAVLGFSELLIDQKVGTLNVRQLEYLKDIHDSGSHLLQLINNVLDLAKIESGKTELAVENFSVMEVTEGVLHTLEPLAAKKNVELSWALSRDIDEVQLDKNKFRQILYNILSNAIKYNKAVGGAVHLITEPRGPSTFTIRVEDTGIGISKENMKKLFIPFVQLDSGMARLHEGSGLGLVLTKNIVELHGGEMGVESTLGVGSTFWITLPISVNQH